MEPTKNVTMSITFGVECTVWYTNHRGERAVRRIVPRSLWFGTQHPYHPVPGWLVEVYDVDKRAERTFLLALMAPYREPQPTA